MVFVNDKKFACESCIKGHRSSSCHHTERPLFEIKKKGRPVSQCEKCRELRKTKRVHSKCLCTPAEKEEKDKREDLKQLSAKSKRYIPIRPTLPNGLKDVLKKPTVDVPADPRAQVGTLLNPCLCKDVWSCKCRHEADTAEGSSTNGGLAALARAAAMCCGGQALLTLEPEPEDAGEIVLVSAQNGKGKEKESRPSCCQPSRPSSPPAKRRRHRSRSKSPSPNSNIQKGPSLPPILCIPPTSALSPALPPPEFPAIPPLNAVASLAGTGCTCGFDCTCPGCVEHRGPQHAEKHSHDCPDGCHTCVDHSLTMELPKSTTYGTIPATPSAPSFMEAFLARAAALPLPPSQRASTINLDPTNVTVYPTSLFDGENKLDERGPAFGLVQLPKLECCAGRCGCPGDSCGCGTACDGCCANDEEHSDCADARERRDGKTQGSEPSDNPFAPPAFQDAGVRPSCCSG